MPDQGQSAQAQKSNVNIRALKEALRKEAERRILKELGVSSLDEAKAKIAGKVQKQNNKQAKQSTNTNDADLTHLEYEVRMELLDAGVKKEDLDYAVWRFVNLLAGKSEDEIKKIEISDFVKTLPDYVFKAGKNPFGDGSNTDQKSATGGQAQVAPSGEGAKTEAKPEGVGKPEGESQKQFATTGAPAPQGEAKPQQGAPRTYADLSIPRSEVDKRWREIMAQFAK
jgi:hypothetical protein